MSKVWLTCPHCFKPLSKRRITDYAAIIEEYKAGKLVKLIAHDHGLSTSTVDRIVSRYNVRKRQLNNRYSANQGASA